MASCQENKVPVVTDAVPLPTADVSQPENTTIVEVEEVPQVNASVPAPLAKAIEEDERKAASKYGNMKKKQSDVMRKRMMGGGKQYFDSGDYNVGKQSTTQSMPQTISPEQPAIEKLRNRKTSVPNKPFSRLS